MAFIPALGTLLGGGTAVGGTAATTFAGTAGAAASSAAVAGLGTTAASGLTLGNIVGWGSAGLGALSAVNAAAATNRAARANIEAAEQEAEQVKKEAVQAEQKKRMETAAYIGAQRANFAASGVDPNEGTPLEVQARTAEIGEEDAITIRTNAAKRLGVLKTEADAHAASVTHPLLAGATSFLSSASKLTDSADIRKYRAALAKQGVA